MNAPTAIRTASVLLSPPPVELLLLLPAGTGTVAAGEGPVAEGVAGVVAWAWGTGLKGLVPGVAASAVADAPSMVPGNATAMAAIAAAVRVPSAGVNCVRRTRRPAAAPSPASLVHRDTAALPRRLPRDRRS